MSRHHLRSDVVVAHLLRRSHPRTPALVLEEAAAVQLHLVIGWHRQQIAKPPQKKRQIAASIERRRGSGAAEAVAGIRRCHRRARSVEKREGERERAWRGAARGKRKKKVPISSSPRTSNFLGTKKIPKIVPPIWILRDFFLEVLGTFLIQTGS
uniref:Uncharacterized protein n=1 Tax=Leersia perrieri TaxID=77586 RepID=A0A0D9V497_9ORYZ